MVVEYVSRVLIAFIAFRMNSLVLESAGQQVCRGQELWWAVISLCNKELFKYFFCKGMLVLVLNVRNAHFTYTCELSCSFG